MSEVLIDRSVLEQALEALGQNEWGTAHHDFAVTAAIRAALEQPQQTLKDAALKAGIKISDTYIPSMEDAIAAGDSVLMNEQAALLRECRLALDSLIKQKPTLAGLRCGSTTLGNLKAELYAYRPQGVMGTSELEQPVEQEPEYWRPVVGFEGLYEVSSKGDIRNLKTNAVLAKNKMGAGYVKADLWRLGTRTQTSAHRVVAEAFLGSTEGLEVNHINGDKSDNRVSNLEIVTKKENESHSRYVLGNLVKPVIARNLADGTEFEFESVNAARVAGFLPSSVYKCCYGICKQHKGHAFRFKNPDHANCEKALSVTHPQPPRQPLTDEQIKRIDANTHFHESPDWLVRFARAIERAHGIGEQE